MRSDTADNELSLPARPAFLDALQYGKTSLPQNARKEGSPRVSRRKSQALTNISFQRVQMRIRTSAMESEADWRLFLRINPEADVKGAVEFVHAA